jgi:pyruvate/2-oxoglutarate dehydrogenase complex dihydrolipoamide dehydrogenase (E3) component
VPSKALIKSSRVANQMRHGDHYGLSAVTPEFSFRKVMARVHEVISTVAAHASLTRGRWR